MSSRLEKLSRRNFLKISGFTVGSLFLEACGGGQPPRPNDTQATSVASGPEREATRKSLAIEAELNEAITKATAKSAEIKSTYTSGMSTADALATASEPNKATPVKVNNSPIYPHVEDPEIKIETHTPAAPIEAGTPSPDSSTSAESTVSPQGTPETPVVANVVTEAEASCKSIKPGTYVLTRPDGSQELATCALDASGKKHWKNQAGNLVNGLRKDTKSIATVTPASP